MGNLSQIGFDAGKVEPSQDFTPIPVGDYVAMISSSEFKNTNDALGQYLKLTFRVLEGQYQNRLVFAMLNLINKNEDTEAIAQRNLSAICHAINVIVPDDSVELHDKPMLIKVGIKQSEGYDPQNVIKAYKSLDKKENKSAIQNDVAQLTQNSDSGKKPWKK